MTNYYTKVVIMSNSKTTHRSKLVGRPKGDVTPKTILAKKLQITCGPGNYSDFSALFGVSSVAVSRYLTGSKVPVVGSLASLHVSTGVDLNWLLNDADDREGPVFVRKRRK